MRSHRQGWQARIRVRKKKYALGTWSAPDVAAVAWDVANVWRSLNASSTQASQLYNHPQLRLWEDAALVASLRGIQSCEQMQTFVKAWVKGQLPSILERLGQPQQGVAAEGAAP